MSVLEQGARQLSIWESGYVVAGRYEVVRCLGIGSMGVVYLCRHRALDGFLVALKVLNPTNAVEGSEEQFFARFRNEILATRSINHPNVVCTYDYVSEPGLEAYSMEFMRGGDLATYLRRVTHMDLRNVVKMLIQMCAGVQAIHDANFMHRDLKPENFLLSGSRQIKIADFGIARNEYGPRITARGGVVGTVQYLSPEYLQTSEYTKQGDIYSLGTLAYEMITGAVPYGGNNLFQIVELKLRSDPPPPHERNPWCPDGLSRIVMRALQRDLSLRYPSAGEMEQDCRAILEKEPLRGAAGPRRALNLPSVSASFRGLPGYQTQTSRLGQLLARAIPLRPPRHPARIGIIMACGILLGMLPVLYEGNRLARMQAVSAIEAEKAVPPTPVAKVAEMKAPARPASETVLEEVKGPQPDTSPELVAADSENPAAVPAGPELVIGKEQKLEEISSKPESNERLHSKAVALVTPAPAAKNASAREKKHPGAAAQLDLPSRAERFESRIEPPPASEPGRVMVTRIPNEPPSLLDPAPEYKVRATLLYRFADYVNWPEDKLSSASQPINICIKGKDPFGSFLDDAVQKVRTRAGRPLRVFRFTKEVGPSVLSACQLLYLSGGQRAEIKRTTDELQGAGVLVISEDTGRGIINFVVQDRKVKFEIDVAEASKAGLGIQQVLLDLASQVRGA